MKGKYTVKFKVNFEETEEGRDIGERFILGVLSDVNSTHGLKCEDIKISEKEIEE